MKKKDFLAITSYACRDEAVDRDLTLFITGTDAVTNTVLMELLLGELKNSDGRICLAVSDYHALNHSFPEIVRSDRVQLVYEDSREFIRVLSQAGRIFTIWYLPTYFVKKEEQIVYQVSSAKRLEERSTGSAREYHYIRTGNNTDYVLRDGFYDELRLDSGSPEDRIAVLLPSSHQDPSKEAKRLRRVRKRARKGRIIYGISAAAWDYCMRQLDLEPDLLADVYPFTLSVREILEKARVIVSANDGVVTIADRSGSDCVFYGRSENKLSEGILSSLDVYDGMEEGYRILIENRHKDAAVNGGDPAGPMVTMDDFVPCPRKMEKERFLIETDWSNRREYAYLLDFFSSLPGAVNMDYDFLFHQIDRKELADESDGVLRDMNMLIRSGMYQCGDEELPEFEPGDPPYVMKDEDVRREWKRILGNVKYEQAWLSSESRLPFSAMRDQVPAKKSRVLSDQEICHSMAERFIGSRETFGRASLPETAESCLLNGEEFLSLGKVEGEEIFLSRKAAEKPYVLVKYDPACDRQIREKLGEFTGDEVNVIIVDPTKKLNDLPDATSVITIPVHFAPPALIAGCEQFLISGRDVETNVARITSVPIQMIDI